MTLVGLAEAEAVAGLLNARNTAPSNAEVVEVFRKISPWPQQCRPNVSPGGARSPFVSGIVLGLAPNRSGSCSISQASLQCPELTRFATSWVATSLGDPEFRFGSIQVNFNYAARKHVDANNLGPSYIMSLGDHEGGALWTSDRGLIDCKGRWASFDGNTEHETKPYEGRERFSFILFTPDAYNRLPPDVCATARDLGLTAASTDGFDDAYFAQFRDLGVVDEREFDAYTDDHHVEHPPRLAPGTICVETNGYAAGRGWGWISWPTSDSTDDDDRRLEKLSNSGRLARFQKNQTGIHVVELQAKDGDDTEGLFFHLVDIHRFRLYQHTASESKRFADWVRALPDARVVACCITDTAMAKTRPLPGTVYDAFRQLGAPTDLTLIGYREPFCFVGWKNAPSAAAVYMLDAKKQSKQLLRIDATLQRALNLNLSPSPSPGGGLKLLAATKATFNLLDELDDRRNKKKKQRGGPANSTGPNADNRKRPKTGDQG